MQVTTAVLHPVYQSVQFHFWHQIGTCKSDLQDGVLDWMIGFVAPYTLTKLGATSNTALSLIYEYTHFTVHRYTRT
jgi:hypothetical protein